MSSKGMFFRDETYRVAAVCLIFNRFYRICGRGVGVVSWGRKDGFPGADGSTITQTSGIEQNAKTIQIYDATEKLLIEGSANGMQFIGVASAVVGHVNALTYAIKNPLTYIYSTYSELYDWYTTNMYIYQNNDLWTPATKSFFDPCPAGWQTPRNGTWNDFSASSFYTSGIGNATNVSNGKKYNQTAWFPATGYRSLTSGALFNVGNSGYYWSSSASGTNAQFLYFSMNNVSPNNIYYRVYGYPVRCIQE